MDYFRDPYGILALAAAKEDCDDDQELSEREDFIGELTIVLQSVKTKLCGKSSDFLVVFQKLCKRF